MARIGMYGVFYAKAVVKDGVVVGYSGDVKTMGKAISAEFSPSTPESNPLYANNGISEDDVSGASGGTLKTVMDRLTLDAMADLFGTTVETVKVTVNDAEVEGKALKYKGDEVSAPVGVAYIRMNQEDGVRNHEVVFYRRATFSMPNQNAKTKGKTIEWQTPELNGTVAGLEGDGSNPWYESVIFPTQAAAIAYINTKLSEKAPEGSNAQADQHTGEQPAG